MPHSDDGPKGLRIVGGRFRTRRLAYSGDRRVRPMKDRTREAVFNLLGPGVKGTHVWDLFAGTGAMALESLSRGARSATMLERHLGTSRLIQQNAETLQVSHRAEVVQTNAFFWARAFLNRDTIPRIPGEAVAQIETVPNPTSGPVIGRGGVIEGKQPVDRLPTERADALSVPWTVFCCPPYAFYADQFDDLRKMLTAIWDVAPDGSQIVVEAEIPFDFTTLWEGPWRVREYAPAAIGIVMRREDDAPAEP